MDENIVFIHEFAIFCDEIKYFIINLELLHVLFA